MLVSMLNDMSRVKCPPYFSMLEGNISKIRPSLMVSVTAVIFIYRHLSTKACKCFGSHGPFLKKNLFIAKQGCIISRKHNGTFEKYMNELPTCLLTFCYKGRKNRHVTFTNLCILKYVIHGRNE